MAKPKPVPRNVVCSECGLSWADHTKDRKTDPTPDVCIRLMKAELATVRGHLQAAQRRAVPSYASSGTTILPFGKAQ